MPELDCIRGLAVVLVVMAHLFGWSIPDWSDMHAVQRWPALGLVFNGAQFVGWLAVQCFFALSGFLITLLLVGQVHRRDYYRRFYIRRALRVQPAFLLTMMLAVVFGHFGWGVQPMRGAQIAACALFAANLAPITGIENPYGPFWTLAIEEQFYLAWPSVVRRYPRRTVAAVCLVILLAGPCMRLLSHRAGADEHFMSATWFNLDALAAGSMLATVLGGMTRAGVVRLGGALVCAGCALLAVQASLGGLPRSTTLGATLFTLPWTLCFAGLIACTVAFGAVRPIGQSRIARLLRFFAFVSYGLYLYHVLIMHAIDRLSGGLFYLRPWERPQLVDVLIRVMLVFGVATTAAFVSRTVFEAWFLSHRRAAERACARIARRMRGWWRAGSRPMRGLGASPSIIDGCPPSASTTPSPASRFPWSPSPARAARSLSTAAVPPSTTMRTSETSAAS